MYKIFLTIICILTSINIGVFAKNTNALIIDTDVLSRPASVVNNTSTYVQPITYSGQSYAPDSTTVKLASVYVDYLPVDYLPVVPINMYFPVYVSSAIQLLLPSITLNLQSINTVDSILTEYAQIYSIDGAGSTVNVLNTVTSIITNIGSTITINPFNLPIITQRIVRADLFDSFYQPLLPTKQQNINMLQYSTPLTYADMEIYVPFASKDSYFGIKTREILDSILANDADTANLLIADYYKLWIKYNLQTNSSDNE